jgi:hypothetical protein
MHRPMQLPGQCPTLDHLPLPSQNSHAWVEVWMLLFSARHHALNPSRVMKQWPCAYRQRMMLKSLGYKQLRSLDSLLRDKSPKS